MSAQIALLNLRINDMMCQLNIVVKTLMEENISLKKENNELKAMPKDHTDEK